MRIKGNGLKLITVCVCMAGILLASKAGCEETLEYKFLKEKKIVYGFSMEGYISYQYEGAPEDKFDVLANGNITVETVENKTDVYKIKLTPSKTFVQMNKMVLEDLRKQDNDGSQLISTSMMEIRKTGEIVSLTEISSGLLDISQLFALMPVFPENLLPGKSWQQSFPELNLPGVPSHPLEFTYFYKNGNESLATIEILSNKQISEKRKDGNLTDKTTGLNSSNGTFLFNKNHGEIESFNGVIDLVIKTVFEADKNPADRTAMRQTLPFTAKINLKVKMTLK